MNDQQITLRKIKPLGSGSYGTVHLALTNIPSMRLLAVKSSDYCLSYSLLKEQLILARLAHCPEVVRCFGSQTSLEYSASDGGQGLQLCFNLLLEYAPGGTLADIIFNHGGRLAESHISVYTRMLLKGLRSIHSEGFVHCDLKPANILAFHPSLANGGLPQLKIADFGLAKLPGEKDQQGEFLRYRFRGTPRYMSPESVSDGLIEPVLDIWSLGCIVVEMFTGRPALPCRDLNSLAFELGFLKTELEIPETLSAVAKDFVRKCFANPRERWTAEMLLNHPFVASNFTVGRGGAGDGLCPRPGLLPQQMAMAQPAALPYGFC